VARINDEPFDMVNALIRDHMLSGSPLAWTENLSCHEYP
jgi:hypothetical protein